MNLLSTFGCFVDVDGDWSGEVVRLLGIRWCTFGDGPLGGRADGLLFGT